MTSDPPASQPIEPLHEALGVHLFEFMNGSRADAPPFARAVMSWHSFDEVEHPVDSSGESFRRIREVMLDFRFSDIRIQATTTGAVAQYVIVGTAGETPLRAPACMVITVESGRIARMAEYVDRGQLEALARRLAGN